MQVGVAYGKHEFWLVFCVPYSLSMRTYAQGSCKRISVDDWLVSDFPTILATRLSLSNPSMLRLAGISNFIPGKDMLSVIHGDSLPSKWVDAFSGFIASYFLNLYADKI